jgi:hypothetical protein
MLFTAAALAGAPAEDRAPRPVGASVQAQATIRVISGVQLHFGDEVRNRDGFIARESTVRSGGVEQSAKLLEFQ